MQLALLCFVCAGLVVKQSYSKGHDYFYIVLWNFAPPKTKKSFWGPNFGGGFGGLTKRNSSEINVLWKYLSFRVFYLESVSPEPNESSIIMKIGFKFAKIEYFQNLQQQNPK